MALCRMATTSIQVRRDDVLKKPTRKVLAGKICEFTPAASREILASVARIKADPAERLGKFSDAKALIESLKK